MANSATQEVALPRETESPTVPAVGEREYAAALAYLRERSPVDIDAFVARISGMDLLRQPLGRTSECLTIDDVAMVIETDIGTGTAAYLPQREHLARCHECRHAAEIYADILRADTTTYDIDLDVEL